MKGYTYVLELKNGMRYYGSTTSLKRRVDEHRHGMVKATKNKFEKLLRYKEFETSTEAITFERKIKKSKNKKYIQRLFTNDNEAL